MSSCNQEQVNRFKIIGEVDNIPASKVYLTDAYHTDHFFDSAYYENGKFEFNIDTKVLKEPFAASIRFLDSNNKIRQLIFINYKRSNSVDTFGNSAFFLEKGITKISGDYNEKYHRVNVRSGKETDLFYDKKTELFGGINQKFDRNTQIKRQRQIITDNPFSYYLLSSIYENRRFYSPKELTDILSLFNKDVQASKTANKIKLYASNVVPLGTPFPDVVLVNTKNEKVNLFQSEGKLNMLVFWASWCGPCRKEIPAIKKIYNSFSTWGLIIKSISVDENQGDWQKALSQEQMDWEQLILEQNSKAVETKAHFEISSIPLIVFTNSKRKEIKRFIGYQESNVAEYNKFISEYLKKQ
jgi:thiol-disulfide isomerase/thioredoxin